jgi:hypothetical protein
MNTKTTHVITAAIDVELTPRARAVMEALHKALSPEFRAADEPVTPAIALATGERYAGVVLDADGKTLHHLVLLPNKPTGRLTWQDAMDWATSIGGHLPTRQEQALLYANCKPHLEQVWHWSCETYEGDASFAWLCYFTRGYQFSSHKSYEGAAVAVRRV